MALTVKICGLSNEATVEAALAAGADMIGLVLFEKSPRHVPLARARELATRVRGRAEIVALLVDPSAERMREVVDAVLPDWVQLHGSETEQAVDAVRRSLPVKVMKALPVTTSDDLDTARRYASVADCLLFDAKPPKGADRPGGHGRRFVWTLLAGFDLGRPYLLSGGLDADNVAAAIAITGAPGVDVSSGVERSPGDKDPDLIRAFIAAARKADLALAGQPKARLAS